MTTSFIEAIRQATTMPELLDQFDTLDLNAVFFEDRDFLHPFTNGNSVSFGACSRTHFQALTRARLAATAVAIKLYDHDHGQRPDTLEQLVPDYLAAVPLDPMANDGSTIRYLPEGVTPAFRQYARFTAEEKEKLPKQPFAIIYSVGADGIDDGGLIYFDNDGTIADFPRYRDDEPGDHHFLLDRSPEPVIDPNPIPLGGMPGMPMMPFGGSP